jgi:type VI protein secretion system component VasK
MNDDLHWIALATSPSVVRRATVVAIVVGTILVAINHGDAILRGEFGVGRLLRIALTVMVPYCVSTYSSVSALRASAREHRDVSQGELR